MRTYARVEQDSVTELFATDGDIAALFHRDMRWIDVTEVTGIACGWRYDGMHFSCKEPDPVASHPAAWAAPEPVLAEGAPSHTDACDGSFLGEASGG
jgi:hypothetical protein